MSERLVDGDRLVYLLEAEPGGSVWDENWSREQIDRFLALDARAALGEYEPVFLPWLDHGHPVLEAGCGPCRYVHGLRSAGLNCLGIDNSRPLLAAVKRAAPRLPLAAMDVRRLAFRDGSLGACISLGVLEHFPEGMEAPLAEARRVLQPGGLLLASVPCFNPWRQRLARRGRYGSGDKIDWGRFYQYALTEAEFRRILAENGFEPLKAHYLHTIKGLRDELPWVKKLYALYRRLLESGAAGRLLARLVYLGPWLVERLAKLPPVRRWFSHMVLVVARKA